MRHSAHAQTVYWTNGGRIQRALADGTGMETVLANRVNRPLYFALDEYEGKIYWTDGQVFGTAPVIRRCNFDGTNIENIVTQGLSGPAGIALDAAADKLYWADTGLGTIRRANLDGSNPEIVVAGLVLPHGLAIDPVEGRLYWSGKADDFFTTVLRRAHLDGNAVETVYEYPFGGPTVFSVTVDATNRQLYWRDTVLRRCALDGSAPVSLPINVTNVEGAIDIDPVAGLMYWADGHIYRANLDGTGQHIVVADAGALLGLALNHGHRRLFWAVGSAGDARIRAADVDGGNVVDVVTPVINPQGLSIDKRAGYLYWADPGSNLLPDGAIRRSHLNGYHVETLVHTGWLDANGEALDVERGRIFFLGKRAVPVQQGSIERAPLNGGSTHLLVTAGLITPKAIALDLDAEKMYWTDTGARNIRRADMSGQNIENLVTVGLTTPNGIALDVQTGKMYWTDGGTMKVQWANLDGTMVDNLLPTGQATPEGIAVDELRRQLYWVERDTYTGSGVIRRAQMDGTDAQDAISIGLSSPRAIALDERARGDVDASGQADLRDYQVFQNCFAGPDELNALPVCSFFDAFPVDGRIDRHDVFVWP